MSANQCFVWWDECLPGDSCNTCYWQMNNVTYMILLYTGAPARGWVPRGLFSFFSFPVPCSWSFSLSHEVSLITSLPGLCWYLLRLLINTSLSSKSYFLCTCLATLTSSLKIPKLWCIFFFFVFLVFSSPSCQLWFLGFFAFPTTPELTPLAWNDLLVNVSITCLFVS